MTHHLIHQSMRWCLLDQLRRLNRLRLPLLGLVALWLGAEYAQAQPASGQPSTAKRPNIVFILVDDLGWGDLGCFGNRFIRTPSLDRMAREGTRFTQFYVNGSVCSPSRTAFLTGRFPARHAIHGHLATDQQNAARAMPNWLDPQVTTLPALLKKAGYATAHFGKWHLGSGPAAPSPTAYGIDDHRTVNGNGPSWKEEQSDKYFRAHSTKLIVDEAIRFITSHGDQPFAVNLWTLVPHAPLNPTPDQLKLYQRLQPGGGVPYPSARQIYYASVTDLDAQVGRLLDFLDQRGLSRNTLVVFSSDNGPEEIFVANAGHSGVGSPGPFRGRKRSLYEGGVRVPLIVRWPAATPAGRIDDTSILAGVDLLPSICKLVGVDAPSDLDGEDLSPALAGKTIERQKPLMWQWRFNVAGPVWNICPILSIRQGRWKLLMNPDRSRIELFDIPADPMESHNLADHHPQVVERMSRLVLDWQATLPKGPLDANAGSNAYAWPKEGR